MCLDIHAAAAITAVASQLLCHALCVYLFPPEMAWIVKYSTLGLIDCGSRLTKLGSREFNPKSLIPGTGCGSQIEHGVILGPGAHKQMGNCSPTIWNRINHVLAPPLVIYSKSAHEASVLGDRGAVL